MTEDAPGEPAALRRGRGYHTEVQEELRRESAEPLKINRKLGPKEARRRPDVWMKWEGNGSDETCAMLIEIKSTDWDSIEGRRIRTYVRRQSRQLLDYLGIAIDVEKVGTTPSMLFPKAPEDPFKRIAVEVNFAEAGLNVMWHATADVTPDSLMLTGIEGVDLAAVVEEHLSDLDLDPQGPTWFSRMLRRPLRPLQCGPWSPAV